MKRAEYASMAQLENTYWWFVGRRAIVDQQIKNFSQTNLKILNVGSGTGGLVSTLSRYGQVTNIDTSPEAVRLAKQRGVEVKKVEGIKLPFRTASFDLVVATDVLEHIETDTLALKEWQRVIKPGGRLLLTIPAYPWLWSSHDENLHHFRRYTAASIHQILNLVGFKVKKRSYVIVFSFPLVVGYRLLQSLANRKQSKVTYVKLPGPLNWLFTFFLKLEAQALRLINFPIGTSILVVAQK